MGLFHSKRLIENNSKVSTISFCFTETEINGVFHYTNSIQFALIVQMLLSQVKATKSKWLLIDIYLPNV